MTRRSRSSFDLRDALAAAEALSPKPPSVEPELPAFGGLPLVAFGGEQPSQAPPPPAPVAAPAEAPRSVPPKPPLPSAPDVSSAPGLLARLGMLIDWLRGDPEVARVLVVDDQGLPLIGSAPGETADAESLLAATGTVANAMKRLALATPGGMSPDFEGHVGEGPVLQLVGFSAARRAFVVGISRRTPFGAKDVDRIRATFAAALEGAVLAGAPLGHPLGHGAGPDRAPGSR